MGYVPNLYFPTWMVLLHRQAINRRKNSIVSAFELTLNGKPPIGAALVTLKLLALNGVILKKLTFLFLSFLVCKLRLKEKSPIRELMGELH